jgi:hypothetical protein
MVGSVYFVDKTGRVVYDLEDRVLRLREDVNSDEIVDGSGLFEGLNIKVDRYVESVPASKIANARCEVIIETGEKLREEIKVLKERLGDDFVKNESTEREIGGIFDLDTEYMRTMNRYFECLVELEENRSQGNNSALLAERFAFSTVKDDILKGISNNLEVFSWVDFSKGVVGVDALNSLLDICKTTEGFVDGYYRTSVDILGNGVTLDDLKFRVGKVLEVLNKRLEDYGVALVFDMKEWDSESILWDLSWDVSYLDKPVECKQYFDIAWLLGMVIGEFVNLMERGIGND